MATKVVTGKVRFSYVNVFEPQVPQAGGDPKYSVTLLIPKSDTVTVGKIRAAIAEARENFCKKNGASALPVKPSHTLHDGDGVRDSGDPYGPECRGCFVITVSSKNKPVIVDNFRNEITDPNEVYSILFVPYTYSQQAVDTYWAMYNNQEFGADDSRVRLASDFLYSLQMVDETVKSLSKVFLYVGLVMAVVLFMKRAMASAHISVVRDEVEVHHDGENDEVLTIPAGTEVFEIEGPFFFGIANKFDELTRNTDAMPIRIIRMRKVTFIDATGLHNLEIFIQASHKEGRTIILSGVHDNVEKALQKAGLVKLVGAENVCSNIHLALKRAQELSDSLGAEK